MYFHRSIAILLFILLPLVGLAISLYDESIDYSLWSGIFALISVLLGFCFVTLKFHFFKPLSMAYFLGMFIYTLSRSNPFDNSPFFTVLNMLGTVIQAIIPIAIIHFLLLNPVYKHFEQQDENNQP